MKYRNLRKIKYWGASTAAHQVEGGNHNQWSVWELENATELANNAQEKYGHLKAWDDIEAQATKPENYISGRAVDHYHKYEEDFDILKSLNMNALRFSIEWSRIEPEMGQWDEKEIAHYRHYLKSLKERNITPFVTLWHWTMPVWFTDIGGFEKRSNVKHFIKFVEKVADELGDLMQQIIILNEPNVYSSLSYSEGLWPPQKKSVVWTYLVQKNLIVAHKKAYKSLKKRIPKSQVGTSNQASYIYTVNESKIQQLGAWSERTFWNYWFYDRVKKQCDFIGLNFYFSDRWTGGLRPNNPQNHTNDLGWDMQPANIEEVIVELYERYEKPVYITENGLADRNDANRKWWLEETIIALDKAISRGAKVPAYLHWSLLDNFEWADGFWPRFGLVEVDYKTLKRTIRPSAQWFGKLLKKITDDA